MIINSKKKRERERGYSLKKIDVLDAGAINFFLQNVKKMNSFEKTSQTILFYLKTINAFFT